ncbi:ABC transporter permease [Leifsonia naganoensis]|uniref:Peptide/nickel transport system permease protein n=1 Tax=Leifsonia naganoensis TaxID=150025 RepID=A0A853DWX1_9MICO|nr:ABC transporter permease [Leifsonia naganoensis]NYK10575.1 peptide/nickel transport system permease protein [Leifsonia naganoensis]
MFWWLIRRFGQMVLVLFGVVSLAFLLVYAVPADPAATIAGPHASAETIASIRAQLGLDAPLWQQYLGFLGRLLHGDLGTSYVLRQTSVFDRIMAALPTTILVAVGGILWQIILGVPAGIYAAYRRGGWVDRSLTFIALLGLSAPPFWLGLLLIYYFAFTWGLFPLNGLGDPIIWYLVLPTFTLGAGGGAWYARMTRTNMIETLDSPFVKMARAKGMPERTILWRHCFRHVAIPLLTMIGLDFGYFLGGVVIVETVFGLNGIGRLAFDAISNLDTPMIIGTVLFAAVFIVLVNFIVDLLYSVIDPRVRLSRT